MKRYLVSEILGDITEYWGKACLSIQYIVVLSKLYLRLREGNVSLEIDF